MYHYTGCGLNNVWLVNGYKRTKTPYGEGVSIENIHGLHRSIAMQLIRSRARLSGPEFRFLRIQLDTAQSALGAIWGVTDQTIALWEKGKLRVPKWADRYIRFLVQEHITGRNAKVTALLKHLNSLEMVDEESRWTFEDTDDGWRIKAA